MKRRNRIGQEMNRRVFLQGGLLSAAAITAAGLSGAGSAAVGRAAQQPGAHIPGVAPIQKFITSFMSVTFSPSLIQIYHSGIPMIAYDASDRLQFPAFVQLVSPQTHLPLSPVNASPAIAFVCDSVSGTNYTVGGQPSDPIDKQNLGQIRSQGLEWGGIRDNQVEFIDSCVWYDRQGEPQLSDRRRFRIVFFGSYRYGIYTDISWSAVKTVQVLPNKNCLFGVQPCAPLSPSGGGQMMNSRGETQPSRLWGQPANWMTCWGKINYQPTAPSEGIALLNHPTNPWGVSPWNVAYSGYMSPTSFPFLSKPWTFRAGQALNYRYLVLAYAGTPSGGTIDEIYRSYIQE